MKVKTVFVEDPAEAPTISTGLLALWIERLTPDQEDVRNLSLAGKKFMR
jgi:hypothetical protein